MSAASKSPTMPVPGELVRLAPQVRRLTQDNPSMFTAVGTNTHLIGDRRVFILDPGPDSDAHFDRIVAAVGDATVAAVIPTHHHLDHWPLAPRLAAHFGARRWASPPAVTTSRSARWQMVRCSTRARCACAPSIRQATLPITSATCSMTAS